MGTVFFQANDEAIAADMNRTMVVGSTAVPGANSRKWYGKIRHNGATWEITANHSVAGLDVSKLNWNATNDELDITLVVVEDYIAAPSIQATPDNSDTAYWTKAGVTEAAGVFTGHISFYDNAGARVIVESTDMDCNVTIEGQYAV